ncbi:hypothetical protein UR09_04295 [Candidatus Nitromaritima sp. SCGC AAA799-A02]|nr:hypothetical protein UR09_04295 [Candidatus Nitromaritima sp. SCGC AAA799-A02]
MFTKPGDLVFDPFMGSGTTLVEAHTLGRKSLGTDINELACFLAKVKTKPLLNTDFQFFSSWAPSFIETLNVHSPSVRATDWINQGYQRNINTRSTWPIRKMLELALAKIEGMKLERRRNFARCAILRTAQWALDCRTQFPKSNEFRKKLALNFREMINDARTYTYKIKEIKNSHPFLGDFGPTIFNSPIQDLEKSLALPNALAPSLILTSPPYPGVHALYHRWQVQGRRETPAPFWIANCFDGNGAAFYTLGDRKQKSLENYFDGIKNTFENLRQIATPNTLVVQLIGFSDPSWQLPSYNQAMRQAGFEEIKIKRLGNMRDGRLWRNVPNRKWYARVKGNLSASKEVVLFHRLKKK